MSFRIGTVLYVLALVASALATFGLSNGAAFATLILIFWASMFWAPRATLITIGSLILLLVIAHYTLPRVPDCGQALPERDCQNNMERIVMAIFQHDTTTGRLPGPYLTGPSGTPFLSWRVFILPYMERNDLFEKFDLQQDWDSPANQPLSSQGLPEFNCPGLHPYRIVPTTNYLAVVGERTFWPPNSWYGLRAIKDDRSQTILMIEKGDSPIAWTEPRDLSFDEATDWLSSPLKDGEGHRVDNGFFFKPSLGRNVAFANGETAMLPAPLDRNLAAALLTADGGEQIDMEALRRRVAPKLDYSRCFSFGLFVLLSLLPAAALGQRIEKLRQARLAASDNQAEPNS